MKSYEQLSNKYTLYKSCTKDKKLSVGSEKEN